MHSMPPVAHPPQRNIPLLRDYQVACVNHVTAAVDNGEQSIIFSLPTSTGKGVIIGRLAEEFSARGRVLVIVHRHEIVEQLADHCRTFCDPVGVVMANRDEVSNPIIVASVQTLHPKRLQRLIDASPVPIATLLIDEAHHATAASYRKLMDRLRNAYPNLAVVGCTATPFRADKDDLHAVFGAMVFERTIPDMQAAGWLALTTYERVVVPLHLADM